MGAAVGENEMSRAADGQSVGYPNWDSYIAERDNGSDLCRPATRNFAIV